MPSPTNQKQCVIVGGGLSGLSLAWFLKQRVPSLDLVVLEAGSQPGGVIHSQRLDGCLVETAAASFLTRESIVLSLIKSLGLESRVLPASRASGRRMIYKGGRLRVLSRNPVSVFSSRVLSLGGSLRLLAEPLVPQGRGKNETVKQFASRRLGAEAADTLMGALMAGIFAGDIDKLEMASSLPRLHAWEHQHGGILRGAMKERRSSRSKPKFDMASFDEGMGVLPQTLAKKLEKSYLGQAAVSSVRPQEQGWLVNFSQGAITADHLVLAVPPPKAAKLVEPWQSELAERMNNIEHAPVAAVTFVCRKPQAVPKGFGFLVPPGEDLPILGCMFSSQVFPSHAPRKGSALRVMLGGYRNPEAATRPDTQVINQARAALTSVLGSLPLEFLHIVQWPHGIPQYNVGHADTVKAIQSITRNLDSLHVCGNGYRGIGVADCVREADQLAGILAKEWTS